MVARRVPACGSCPPRRRARDAQIDICRIACRIGACCARRNCDRPAADGPPVVVRRPRALIGWIAAVAVVGAAIGGFAVVRLWEANATAAMGPPRFVDETTTSGIDHSYGGEFAFAVGGGVAAFDCDTDGRQDLYLAGAPSLPRSTATAVTSARPLRSFAARIPALISPG